MAGQALLINHLRGCGFRPEIEDELFCLGIFAVVALRRQFCIGVRFARAVTPVAIGRGTGLSHLGSCVQLRCVCVDGLGNLFDRGLVTMRAGLHSRQLGDIGRDGSLPGNSGRSGRGGRLSERNAGCHQQQGQS